MVKGLFERGLSAEQIRQLFRVIDWLMELPDDLERQFHEEIHQFEEEKKMPYVTSIERMAREEGLEQGLEQGMERGMERGREEGRKDGLRIGIEVALENKFGPAGLDLLPLVQAEQRIEVLREVQRSIWTAGPLEEVRALLPQHAAD